LSKKEAPRRGLFGAEAGKSNAGVRKPALYDYHESAFATVARASLPRLFFDYLMARRLLKEMVMRPPS
jgi:hypothetical protein